MYLCLCHTCESRRTVTGLAEAQAWFTEHVERAHEAEFRSLEVEPPGGNSSSDDGETSPGRG